MSAFQWFKNVNGKSWHAMSGDKVMCGRHYLVPEPKKYGPRDFPAYKGRICKGCLHRLADNYPEDLIGLAWFEQPEESELEEI